MIGLDRADAQGFRKGLSLFGQLPQPHHLIWNDGPRIAALREDLGRQGLAPLERGKGNNIWLCLGLVQALGRAEVVALHDCDVVSFRPRMLARLVAQLLLPDSGFVFAKAYYPRISAGVMYGRVSRLLVTPLLRALRRCLPASRYLEFLDSFRYPLAGECAMRWSAARRLHLPCDWGMEIGVLTEMFRDHSTRQLCQVDIAGAYDHKHQPFPPETGDEDGGHARSARSRRRLGHQFLQHRRERLACRVGDAGTSPLEVGLAWLVHLEMPKPFIGRGVLERQSAEGVKRRLVGLELQGRAIARHGYPVLHNGAVVGEVTSGSWAPSLGKAIALALVPSELARLGSELAVEIRGRSEPATVVRRPFYRR